ncbi:isopenicillin N synthase family oxygenase [Acetobacter musti]|uniref:2-oxoglutarate-dependent ethylene/succinate-forming enzyme n=1 Tax=Acetobacter musti TaxID=864732 RepID=A0ABX0JKG9_9PROT|nr:isopenicillin N synthase family oxygenase [Acetobacter musti]NHN83278.1 isopenicillin N synthase family oxygenase [Acetobacter musti]
MIPSVRAASADEVPVLDLSAPDGEQALATRLREACLSLGFFYVAGHGVPRTLTENIFAASRRYFALPEEDKRQDLIDERFRRGYMPIGVSHKAPWRPDLKESYEVSLDLPPDDPDVIAGRFLHGPNRWPARHPWLQAAVDPYLAAMLELGERLMRLFALSLDLEPEFFVSLAKKPTMHLRLFHYPPQPPQSPDDQFGIPPHSDLGMLTILNQDPIGGLEVRRRDGEWIAAPWIEDTFVVNVGDLFSVWTNDLYVSTPHRVVNRTGRERYSIPTFFSPDFDTSVSCLPTCLREGETPRYAPMRSGAYLEERLRAGHRFDEARRAPAA